MRYNFFFSDVSALLRPHLPTNSSAVVDEAEKVNATSLTASQLLSRGLCAGALHVRSLPHVVALCVIVHLLGERASCQGDRTEGGGLQQKVICYSYKRTVPAEIKQLNVLIISV